MIRKFDKIFKRHRLIYGYFLLIIGLSCLWFLPLRGLEGRYYNNPEWQGEPVLILRDQKIDLNEIRKRHDVFPQRNFSITWGGWIRIDRPGNYIFTTISDDGSSLFVNGVKVVENGGFHGARKATGTIFLTQGMHALQINYFQGAGSYTLRVFWKEPHKPQTVLPSQHLYPRPFSIPGISFLSRHLYIIYGFLWGLLIIGVLIRPFIMRNRGNVLHIAKRYTQNIVLACTTIVVTFMVIECSMRLVLYFKEQRKDLAILLKESQQADLPDNPQTYNLKGMVQASPHDDIVYELKPNLRGQFLGQPVITNSRGLRDFEYSYRKPENTVRIVGIGDSSLFGWGVKLEDTSLKVLERKLNQQASTVRYEVINFAVPGYNTAIETEVFIKKCLYYSPDILLLHFNSNDYDVPNFMKLPQNYSTLRKSYLFDFLYRRYNMLQGIKQEEMVDDFTFNRTINWLNADQLDKDQNLPQQYRYMVGEQGFRRAIDKLVDVVKAHDIPLIVGFVKTYPGLVLSEEHDLFRTQQVQLLTQLSRQYNFFLLDMYPYYEVHSKNYSNKDLPDIYCVSDTDLHQSATAHAIEAEAFYDALLKNKLVRFSP